MPALMRLSLALGLGLLISCAPPPPRFLQVDAPDDTRDGFGTYQVTALMRGVTDSVVATYGPVSEEGLSAGTRLTLRSAGDGRFVGALDGIELGQEVALVLRAEGPGGDVVWPPNGAHTFRVLDASGVCLVDGDCLSGEMCNRLTERCVERTLDCADEGDCPLDYTCDTERGECRFRRSACEDDAQCGRGRVCEDGLCVARPECRDDAECPAGSSCLTPPGRCVADAECQRNADCPADRPRCEAGACVEDFACRPGGCPPGSNCVDGRCVDNAACGGDCPPGELCSEPLGACVVCTADGHCPGDEICINNACVAGPRSAACTICQGGGACGPGFACDFEFGGICAPLCGRDGRCPDGLFCAGEICRSETFCAGFECQGDFDCEGACMAGICEDPQVCAADADCAADRACDDGVCIPRARFCFSPLDCEGGEICLGGRCEPGRAAGECRPCEVSDDCATPSLCADIDGSGPRCIPVCGPDGCSDGFDCENIGGIGLCLSDEGGCREVECGDDAYEGVEPFELEPDQPIRRFVCAADQDEMIVGRPGTLSVQASGTLQLILVDQVTGQGLERQRLIAGEGWSRAVMGNELLVILSRNPQAVGYSVLLEPGAAECDDDVLEDNDQPERATIIGDGANVRPTACASDDDWYRLRADGPGTLFLSVRGRPRGSLSWQLLRGEALELEAEDRLREGTAQIRIPDARPRFLVVRCDDCADGIEYTLQTRFEEGGECQDDPFEPNDALSPAGLDLPANEPGLVLCEGNEDYFVFTVPARTRQRIDLTFTHGNGDIDAELLQDGEVVEASASGTDNERIMVPVSRRDETYVLRVYLFPSTPQNSYGLRIQER